MFMLVYTGYRNAERDKVRADLDTVFRRKGQFKMLVGFDPENWSPTGGDLWAYEWALERGIEVECHPAWWKVPELGKAAGVYRNGYMLGKASTEEDTGVLAHLHPQSRGAAGTARFAELVGFKVRKETSRFSG